jgi:hypothetical protein
MRFRIAMWGVAGFLVAGFWAVFAIATFPSTPARMRDVWTLVCVTCPIATMGTHYPISLYVTLVANAVTYWFCRSGRRSLAEATASRAIIPEQHT